MMWYHHVGILGLVSTISRKIRFISNQENNLGLVGNLVSNFADVLAGCGRRFFHLCYDNFFNSIKLITTLKKKLVKATGTIRDNRSEKCLLVVNNILKKQERGNFNFKTDTKNGILVCKWNDNS